MYRDSFDQKYDYSYSGADCRAYAYFEDKPEQLIHLKHLATSSLSIHEAKSPVRALGHKSVRGFTESVRTIAGSLVLVVVKDHPLKDLILKDEFNYNISEDFLSSSRTPRRKISTLLNKFNMYLIYKTELSVNEKASILIRGIRIVNESIVTSVNDMVSEVMVQFVAEEVEEFDLETLSKTKGQWYNPPKSKKEKAISPKESKRLTSTQQPKKAVEEEEVTLGDANNLLRESEVEDIQETITKVARKDAKAYKMFMRGK